MARAAQRVGFIGGGNMAEALVRGLLAAGRRPSSIAVAEPLRARRTVLERRYKIEVVGDNVEAAGGSDILVLAVKPQVIDEVVAGLAPALTRRHLVVSIAAGVRLARLQQALGASARVIRVMPNTPCLVGRGASVLCAGRAARPADLRTARSLFATVGRAFVVREEAALDAVTGLSGSGPAYVYLFAEALIRGGVRGGLEPALAEELAYETIAGAAEMMLRTGQSPGELRKAVSSPGGTTVAGLARLEEGRFSATVTASVRTATRRSKQLGGSKRRGRT